MNRTLQRIDPWSAAKIAAATAAVFMFIYLLVGLLVMTFTDLQFGAPEQSSVTGSIWLLLLLPFAYLIAIYFLTFVVCLIFNAMAGWFGGIRLELSDD